MWKDRGLGLQPGALAILEQRDQVLPGEYLITRVVRRDFDSSADTSASLL